MSEIKASDRTYVRTHRGELRVLNYAPNGVERSDIYAPLPEKVKPLPVVPYEKADALQDRLEEVLLPNPPDEAGNANGIE
jgi:hypothetical protein